MTPNPESNERRSERLRLRRARYAANREAISARRRAWYASNRDRVRAVKRAWYAVNADWERARHRTYYSKNREALLGKAARRRDSQRATLTFFQMHATAAALTKLRGQ